MDSNEDSLTLTPTSRLARAERQRLTAESVREQRSAWRTPDVLSVAAWRAQLRDDAMLHGAVDMVVLGDDAVREIWRQVIDTDVFVGEPRVVDLAQRAWRTLHEHQLQDPEQWPELALSEDSRAFQRWAERYRAACRERGVIDEWAFASLLPALVRDGRMPLPARIRLIGFELEPVPLLRELLDALEAAGTALDRHASQATSNPGIVVRALPDDEQELFAAARWARAELEQDPDRRIAIVVPDLSARLAQAERVFSSVFDPPEFALEEARDLRSGPPWHISMGPALADWSLVADALLVLGMTPNRIEQPAAGRLVGSPWIDGWKAERTERSEAEAALLRWAPWALTQHELVYALKRGGATILAEALETWRGVRVGHEDSAWPSTWTERFQTELSALGFGHGRPLNSREYQVLRRWHELLEAFAALDAACDRPMPRGQALSRLAERARDASFREADVGSPVEVLGVQEALGSRFDAAWLTALDRDNWPSAARRDPLIPGPVQRSVPTSTSDGCRARAEQELSGLRRIAPILHGSFALGDDEIPRRRTPLIAGAVDEVEEATVAVHRSPPVELDVIAEDRLAPPLAVGPDERIEVRGGTAVLRDQSACPFRALAIHRLGAREVGSPRPGLDAALRGTLLHRALEAFWRDLEGRDALIALDADALAGRIEQAADHALDAVLEDHRLTLSPAGRALEQRCNERLLARWVELERNRGPFDVVAREARIPLRFGPLALTGTVDRIDETPAGPVLIDYKTGRTGRNDWRPDARIKDPQLPAYALSMTPAPVAITFARLRPESMAFDGLAGEPVGIRGVTPLQELRRSWKNVDDFNALQADWRQALDGLAEDFAAGGAAVDPRDDAACRYCHLQALCRIHERDPFAGSGDEGNRE